MLFFGDVPPELRYCLPYIEWRRTGIIYEPLKVKHPIKKFYRTFGGNSKYDIFIKGKKPTYNQKQADGYQKMEEECEEYNLNVIFPHEYYDDYIALLDEIHDKALKSNLGTGNMVKITNRIDKTKKKVKEYLRED